MDQNRSEVSVLPTEDEQKKKIRAGAILRREGGAVAIVKEIFFGVLYAMGGYLLGTCALPFSAYPFGVAILCAAERRVGYLFVGLCLSVIGLSSPVVRALSYVLALLIRIAVRLTIDKPWARGTTPREHSLGEVMAAMFREQTVLRMTTACLGVFFVGVYRLIEGGFLYYDLYGALLGMAVAPVAVFLFSGIDRPSDAMRGYARPLGVLSLACVLVYATRDLRFAYVSVSAFLAMTVTLYATKREGLVKGALAGLALGLSYVPALSPLFALAALCGGLLFPVSATLATLITVVVGSAWAIYARGLGALSGLLPAILSASVLFAVIDRLFLKEKTAEQEEAVSEAEATACCEVLDASAMDSVRLSDTACRVKTVCEGFSAMAEVFAGMGRAMQRPRAEELRAICDNAFDSSCASCQARQTCWESGYHETDAEIAKLSSVLYRDGQVDRRDVGEALAGRCTRLPDILDEINHNASLHAARVLQSDKTEIFAADYAAMAAVLAETMTAGYDEYVTDKDVSARLAERLQALDAGICGVTVWGKECCRVLIRSRASLSNEQCAAVSDVIFEVMAHSMAVEATEEREDGCVDTLFAERERFSLAVAKRTLRAEGEEEYCGDSVGVFARERMQYAFISDGMGSGREAALTSGLCALFLQKMLGAGNRCETVLSMLNGFLRNKGSGSLHECSATVDLMALDRISGRAGFYKCGAAPTYVLRDGSLFKLRSKTLPVGILKDVDQKRIRFELCAGDVIVMVSDGVTQGREECPWLYDLLRRNVETLGIEGVADRIVQYAKSCGSDDDVSVLVLRVEES